MLHDYLRVGAYPNTSPDDLFEDTYVVYDPEQFGSFFSGRSDRLQGRRSENEAYLACWRGRESDGCPAGVCLAKNQAVVHTMPLADVHAATPANDGTTAILTQAENRLVAIGSEGDTLLEDTFESNVSAIAIAPDGGHVAVSTAFPDNAVHIYSTRDGSYLGRTENRTTNVLGHLHFVAQDGQQVVETYEIAPDSDLDVHENRKQVIDRIPVAPQMDMGSLNGVCILVEESSETFHHIPAAEIDDIDGELRIPGVTLESSCGRLIEPLTAAVLFTDPTEAIGSHLEFCQECKRSTATYPETKSEKTHPS